MQGSLPQLDTYKSSNTVSDNLISALKTNRDLQNLIVEEISRIDEEIDEIRNSIKNRKNQYFINYFKIRRNFFTNNPYNIPSNKWTKTEDRQIFNIGLDSISSNYLPIEIYEFINIKFDQNYQPGFVETNPLEFIELFNNKKSLFQIYQRWINFLHPSISKSQFSAIENAKLVRYATVYGMRNWHLIALQMDLIRRPWQCLTQYQQCFNKLMWFSEWNENEDKLLLDKAKNYINPDWTALSNLFRWKTNEQCRLRYFYLTSNQNSSTNHYIFNEYLRGNLTSFGILQTFILKFYQLSRKYKWTPEEDDFLVNAFDQFKSCYGRWSKISQTFLKSRSRHAVIKRFSILCQEQNFERLYDDVWSRKCLISNYSFGDRIKPNFDDLGVFGLPKIPKRQIDKLKRKFRGNLPNNEKIDSKYTVLNHESSVQFNEIFDFWFEKFSYLQELSQSVIKLDWSKLGNILTELNNITEEWAELNPHNVNSLEKWYENSLHTQEKINKITDRINSL